MMGTGPFAVPTFKALYATRHVVAALVTRPARSVHARGKAPVNPMRETALALGAPVLDPEDVNSADSHAALRALAPDLFIVADYGQILSAETLAIAPTGGVNLHASLLPKYRGAAPINWALYHGETETGVTLIHMTPNLDAGPCIAQRRVAIGPDLAAGPLEERLAELGASLIGDTIDALQAGSVEAIPQDPALATSARRLRKSDGRIDWTRSAEQVRNQIRAMQPWPKCHTHWLRDGAEPLRLIIGQIEVVGAVVGASESGSPGTVLQASDDRLVVAAGADAARVLHIQPSGKRMLTAEEFLRGYPVQPGDRFGNTEK